MGFLDEIAGFRSYATFSKSDTIFSIFFFWCQERDLKEQTYLLGSSGYGETKGNLGRQSKNLKDQAGLDKETELLWSKKGETPGVITHKTYCWQSWNCCHINRHQRHKYMLLKGVTILSTRKSWKKQINLIDSALYYRLLLVRFWEKLILQWTEPSPKRRSKGFSHLSSKM